MAIACGALLASCRGDSEHETAAAGTLSASRGTGSVDWEQALAAATPDMIIGDYDSGMAGAPTVFGRVSAAAFAESQDLLVLDEMNSDLRRFSKDGQFVGRFGRPGHGPGEFRGPRHIDVVGDRAFVVDETGRVTLLGIGRSSLQLLGSFRVPRDASGFCALEDRLIYYGFSPSSKYAAAAVAHDGRVLYEFHAVPDSANWLLRAELANGMIACDAGSGSILIGEKASGTLSVYDVAGRLKAQDTLPNYAPLVVRQNSLGEVETALPSGADSFDTIDALVSLGGDVFLVQIATYSFDPAARRRSLAGRRSALLETGTMAFRGLNQPLPRVLAAGPGRLVTYRDEPFPQVRVYAHE
jgi:hypothetical protein